MSKTTEVQLIQIRDRAIKSHRQRVEQTRQQDDNQLIYLALRSKNASETLRETDEYNAY